MRRALGLAAVVIAGVSGGGVMSWASAYASHEDASGAARIPRSDSGGIAGEPIDLTARGESGVFFDEVRTQIIARWAYPCDVSRETQRCEPRPAKVTLEFGILASGHLQYVEVVRSSGFEIYDDYAVKAVRLASPFPTVPPELIARMQAGSTGVALSADFMYVVPASVPGSSR